MTLSTKTVEFDISIKSNADNVGTFSAYGNTFDKVDSAGEKSMHGAFVECIKDYEKVGKMPKFLGQHGHKKNPIGIVTKMVEDEKGLYFEGEFCLDTQEGREAYALCKMGAMDSFSIGYLVERDEYKGGIRELHKLNVKEISLVTFACNEDSLIQSIKSAIDHGEDPTVRQVQDVLREAGFSKRQAAAAVNAVRTVQIEEAEMKTDKERFMTKRDSVVANIELGMETKNTDMSLREYADMICKTVLATYETESRWAYVEAVYMDKVILCVCEEDDGVYEHFCVRIPYTVNEDDVMVGSATKVERLVKWVSEDEKTSMGLKTDETPTETVASEPSDESHEDEIEIKTEAELFDESVKTEDFSKWFDPSPSVDLEQKDAEIEDISSWFAK